MCLSSRAMVRLTFHFFSTATDSLLKFNIFRIFYYSIAKYAFGIYLCVIVFFSPYAVSSGDYEICEHMINPTAPKICTHGKTMTCRYINIHPRGEKSSYIHTSMVESRFGYGPKKIHLSPKLNKM